MTLPAYAVADVPVNGAEAFAPTYTVPAKLRDWGLVKIMGAPGTEAFPAPLTRTSANVLKGSVPETQGSRIYDNETQGTWRPTVYVPLPDNMGPQQGGLGIAVRHHEDLPVPALNVIRVSKPAQRTPPYLGGRVTPFPRVFPRFPTVLDGPSQ